MPVTLPSLQKQPSAVKSVKSIKASQLIQKRDLRDFVSIETKSCDLGSDPRVSPRVSPRLALFVPPPITIAVTLAMPLLVALPFLVVPPFLYLRRWPRVSRVRIVELPDSVVATA